MNIRKLQTSQTTTGAPYDPQQPLPYPYSIGSNNAVLRQDFWKGDPAALIGFSTDPNDPVGTLTEADSWWAGPADAIIGQYASFERSDSSIYTDLRPIADAIELEVADPPAGLPRDNREAQS